METTDLDNANNPFSISNGATNDNVISEQKGGGLLKNLLDNSKQNGKVYKRRVWININKTLFCIWRLQRNQVRVICFGNVSQHILEYFWFHRHTWRKWPANNSSHFQAFLWEMISATFCNKNHHSMPVKENKHDSIIPEPSLGPHAKTVFLFFCDAVVVWIDSFFYVAWLWSPPEMFFCFPSSFFAMKLARFCYAGFHIVVVFI